MKLRKRMGKSISELLSPTKLKLGLMLLLAITAYLALFLTREVYEVDHLVFNLTGGENAELRQDSTFAVQFSYPVMASMFPVSVLFMIGSMGGVPTNFGCDSATCDLVTGTSWIYLAAVLMNLPYYYMVAGFIGTAYEKIWVGEEQ